jgi:hypothetical protein
VLVVVPPVPVVVSPVLVVVPPVPVVVPPVPVAVPPVPVVVPPVPVVVPPVPVAVPPVEPVGPPLPALGSTKLKFNALLVPPAVVTVTPTLVPDGTEGAVARQFPAEHPNAVAGVPPKLTPVAPPRFVPVSVTVVPPKPVDGLMVKSAGAEIDVAVAVGVEVATGVDVGVSKQIGGQRAMSVGNGVAVVKQNGGQWMGNTVTTGPTVGSGKQIGGHPIGMAVRSTLGLPESTGGAGAATALSVPTDSPPPFDCNRLAPIMMRTANGRAIQICRNQPFRLFADSTVITSFYVILASSGSVCAGLPNIRHRNHSP